MQPIKLPDQQRLRERWHYDPDTGEATWKPLRATEPHHYSFNAQHAGKPVGSCSKQRGYLKVRFDGIYYQLHRCLFKLMTGLEPRIVDHADGDPRNNRLSNLRGCNYSDSNANRRSLNRTESGFRGVTRDGDRWRARVKRAGKYHEYGRFAIADLLQAAHAAYRGRIELHGEFANHSTMGPTT